ncbi:ATP synthase F1 subunit delta [Sphingobacterium daejeonense]|jgi:F-type H+-transporting ATPase subunit delta|uniref:ATP synthase subunit delta n=1 Tax=Sphingobacterium daejeonense TaxID=371142 RepID=A0ABW3RHL2_9SPHI|nr:MULTISPECIES: ATP synthase F1 subunit delta [Sphingobacterium]MCT1532920.1 ATP synthase F1 subunit delta [Sphingobacterium daejeonense]VTP91151.1 F-type ATPase subunit delta [Sphingobacterium daejeonense]
MSVFKVASRYAKSLIDLAQEHQNLDAVKADMSDVVAVIKSNTELQAVLNNPIIKTDKKLAILKALFQDKVKPEILEFFNIMVRKGRAELVYATALEFIREYNEVKGIVNAEVISATPLSEANLQALKQEIASQINAEVILANKVDKSLIGGFVVKVGDKQIDASIQGKLNKLERHFESQGV